MTRFARALVVVAVVSLSAGLSRGQGRNAAEVLWTYPEGIVAYAAFDGARLGAGAMRERALVAAGVRGLVSSTVSIQGGSSAAAALLRESVIGKDPYRVCLLELEGSIETRAGKSLPMKPGKFAAVVEVRGPASEHAKLQAAIDAALLADSREDGGRPRTRREVTLAGGVRGQVSDCGDAWREVAWASMPDAFVVAFGAGTLERWVGRAPARTSDWWNQRMVVARKRGKGARVFEAFVDLNALRKGIPDEFDGRPLGNLLHAWKIPNARSFMVHGAFIPLQASEDEKSKEVRGPGMLAIDVSWSLRSEPPGSMASVSVSEAKWPADVAGPPTGEDWALVTRAGVPAWVDLGADTYMALAGAPEFAAIRTRWERRAKPMLERIVPRVGEWAVVRPGLNVTLDLRPAQGPDRLAADSRALFSTLAPTVAAAGKGWTLAVSAAEEPLRGLTWRFDADGLVTQWNEKP